jgi:hypothetical protein
MGVETVHTFTCDHQDCNRWEEWTPDDVNESPPGWHLYWPDPWEDEGVTEAYCDDHWDAEQGEPLGYIAW